MTSPVLASLASFGQAALRPRTPLGKAIVVMLLLKVMVVVAMKLAWFSPQDRPVVTDTVMERHLHGALPSPSGMAGSPRE